MKIKRTIPLIDLAIFIIVIFPTGLTYNEFFSLKIGRINIYYPEIYLFILSVYLILTIRKIYYRKVLVGKITFIFTIYFLFFTVLNIYKYPINTVINDSRFVFLLIFIFLVPSYYNYRNNKEKIFSVIQIGNIFLALNLIYANIQMNILWYSLTSRNNIYFLLGFIISLYRLLERNSTKKNMINHIICLFVSTLAIILIESRLIYILVILSGFLIFLNRITIRKVFKFFIIGVIMFSIFFAFFSEIKSQVDVLHLIDRFDSITRINETASYSIRIKDNLGLLNDIDEKMIFGNGPGSKILQYTNDELAYYIDNTYFMYLYKFGIVGVIFILSIIGHRLRNIKRIFNSKLEFNVLRIIIVINITLISFFSILLYHNYFLVIYMLIIFQSEEYTPIALN